MPNKRCKWPYVVLAIAAFVALLLMIAQDQDVLHVESAVSATDARFADYVASLVGAPVTSGDAYEVLLNGGARQLDRRRIVVKSDICCAARFERVPRRVAGSAAGRDARATV